MENLLWKDKVDGQDDILAEDINSIANYANKLNKGKVDQEDGKGLSSNDFTNALKLQLENFAKSELNPAIRIDDNYLEWEKLWEKLTEMDVPLGVSVIYSSK